MSDSVKRRFLCGPTTGTSSRLGNHRLGRDRRDGPPGSPAQCSYTSNHRSNPRGIRWHPGHHPADHQGPSGEVNKRVPAPPTPWPGGRRPPPVRRHARRSSGSCSCLDTAPPGKAAAPGPPRPLSDRLFPLASSWSSWTAPPSAAPRIQPGSRSSTSIRPKAAPAS